MHIHTHAVMPVRLGSGGLVRSITSVVQTDGLSHESRSNERACHAPCCVSEGHARLGTKVFLVIVMILKGLTEAFHSQRGLGCVRRRSHASCFSKAERRIFQCTHAHVCTCRQSLSNQSPRAKRKPSSLLFWKPKTRG